MPIYRYSAFGNDGRELAGRIEADGIRDAARRLKQDGIFAREIHPEEETTGRAVSRLRRERGTRLPTLTRNLATMVSAGVPLAEALDGLASDQKGPWHSLMVDVKERVSGGSSLSAALGEHPHVFSSVFVGLVAAGEAGGALPQVLRRLADFLENGERIRGRVRTALIYPAVMTVVSAGVLSFLLTFVVPKIATVFKQSNAELPWITRLLLWMSETLHSHWWWILPLVLAAAWGSRNLAQRYRDRLDAVMLDLPVVSTLVRTLATARFARTFSILIEGGLPVVRALEYAGEVTGNARIRTAVDAAARRIVEGSRISTALDAQEIFPSALIHLAGTGERTGRLGEVLAHAADAYENELDRMITRAMALFEPLLIVAMGLAVGTIVIAILLPIFEMNRLVG